jgi:menaquinone-dependent protoporphyrinogen oxidase
MMDVLVSAASKHGATAEIAAEIGKAFESAGLTVTVAPPEDITDIGAFDAFVIGSAVYAGRWRKSAREMVERNASDMAGRPVWLFSSGPLGDPPKPTEDPVDIAALAEATRMVGHRLFAGKLALSSLNFGERAIVASLRAPVGDFRDWEEVRAWAEEIVHALRAGVSPPHRADPIDDIGGSA